MKKFLALAPMEDVTDTVFRQIVAKVGRPDIFFTEFANVDAIIYAYNTSPLTPLLNSGEGKPRGEVVHPGLQRLLFSNNEKPLIAQIWGSDPEKFNQAAKIVAEMGFSGIDINMGCPQRKITKTGGCAALIGNNNLVAEIIAAVKEVKLPVSVKTRLGNKKIITEEWLGFLLDQDLAMLTVHGRTAAELSLVPAHWDEIAKVVKIRDGRKLKTPIVGNGDIKTFSQAQECFQKYDVDGVMIGRGVFENIGVFVDKELSINEKINLFKTHVQLFEQTWGKTKNFAILKKFSKTYINGFSGASEIREKIANTRNYSDLLSILNSLPEM